MEKIKRPLIAHFLDTSQAAAYADAEWARIGINVTEASTEYNPQTETSQDIVSESASTDLTGYQPSMAVSQQCTKGDPVFELITKLRRSRATMGDSYSWALNVDLWDKTGEGASATYAAEVQSETVGSWSRSYRSGGDSARSAAQAAAENRAALLSIARQYLARTGLLYRGGRCGA